MLEDPTESRDNCQISMVPWTSGKASFLSTPGWCSLICFPVFPCQLPVGQRQGAFDLAKMMKAEGHAVSDSNLRLISSHNYMSSHFQCHWNAFGYIFLWTFAVWYLKSWYWAAKVSLICGTQKTGLAPGICSALRHGRSFATVEAQRG